MKKIQRTVGVLAAAFVLCAAGSARASTIEVKVPFSFVVHGATLPAGQYRLENEGSVLFIRGEKGNKVGMFVMSTPAGGHDPNGDQPSLTFTRHETQYQLTNVWESGSQGYQIHR